MTKKSIFLKLYRVKKKWKFFILLLVFILMLILPSMVVTKYSTINGNLTCNMIEKNELSCKFKCSMTPTYVDSNVKRELFGRVIVFHSVWTAMFDKTYRMQSLNTNWFEIELPKRNYTYSAIVSMYDNSNNIGVSNRIRILC